MMDERPTLLVVDDDRAILESLRAIFEREGLHVLCAASGEEGLELLRQHRVHIVLTDLMMPGCNGKDVLRAVRTLGLEADVIVMTAFGTIETAVEAMKDGAYDFVTKPVKRAHIVRVVRKALEKQHLVSENRALKAELEATRSRAVVGQSLLWRRTVDLVLQAAPSQATVLFLGESGTGKEVLARLLHERSPRAKKPFVPVNCAAIPETILEAELFGYERGAFTGAVQRREGRFVMADGGTLFLDEVGEIPPQVQVKLLRVLEHGVVDRLGGKPVQVDIRLCAATNQDLARAVGEGRFREDLYYRLNVIAVHVPPLRDRKDDVPLLAEHFFRRSCAKNGKRLRGISPSALQCLEAYDWPGNVRELENVIERAVVLAKGDVVTEEDLPHEILHGGPKGTAARSLLIPLGTPLDEIERRVIHETLRYTQGDKRLAAQLLGIATRTIYRKLEQDRIKEEDIPENPPLCFEKTPAPFTPAPFTSGIPQAVADLPPGLEDTPGIDPKGKTDP